MCRSSILVLQDQSFFWFAAKMVRTVGVVVVLFELTTNQRATTGFAAEQDRQFSESEWVEGGAVPKNCACVQGARGTGLLQRGFHHPHLQRSLVSV